MVRFATLYSGSSGNSCVVWDEQGSVLVDLGGSCRRTAAALRSLGISLSDVSGVLLTHEHSDHIGGIRTFAKNFAAPIFGTKETERHLRRFHHLEPQRSFTTIRSGDSFLVGGFVVTAFATSHDSDSCLGFRIEKDGSSVAVATDLGIADESVMRMLSGCGTVALESNYDRLMLERGSYPPFLKARIAAPTGHLSNDACASAALRLVGQGTRQLMLMHLSEENNDPALALTGIDSAFEAAGYAADCCTVCAAPRYAVSPVWEV